MKTAIKLLLLFVLLSLFIMFFSFIWVDDARYQAISLITLIIICIVRFGKIKIYTEIKLIFSFLIFMLFVNFFIGFVLSDIHKWATFGILRSLNFLNTILFMQLLISYISISDILFLPFTINIKKYLILGIALFENTLNNISNIEQHLRLIPEYQNSKLSIRQIYNFKLQQSFAIICMILREAKLKGELIDNRIKHCFNDIKVKED